MGLKQGYCLSQGFTTFRMWSVILAVSLLESLVILCSKCWLPCNQDPKQCTWPTLLSYDEAKKRFAEWEQDPKGFDTVSTILDGHTHIRVPVRRMLNFNNRWQREKVDTLKLCYRCLHMGIQRIGGSGVC